MKSIKWSAVEISVSVRLHLSSVRSVCRSVTLHHCWQLHSHNNVHYHTVLMCTGITSLSQCSSHLALSEKCKHWCVRGVNDGFINCVTICGSFVVAKVKCWNMLSSLVNRYLNRTDKEEFAVWITASLWLTRGNGTTLLLYSDTRCYDSADL